MNIDRLATKFLSGETVKCWSGSAYEQFDMEDVQDFISWSPELAPKRDSVIADLTGQHYSDSAGKLEALYEFDKLTEEAVYCFIEYKIDSVFKYWEE